MEKSILDIIAQSTANTIKDVSKLYHETYSEEDAQTRGSSAANEPNSAPDKEEAPKSASSTEPPFFGYGTPFTDIMRFTRDVEVFTRHIDAQSRGPFGRGNDAGNSKK